VRRSRWRIPWQVRIGSRPCRITAPRLRRRPPSAPLQSSPGSRLRHGNADLGRYGYQQDHWTLPPSDAPRNVANAAHAVAHCGVLRNHRIIVVIRCPCCAGRKNFGPTSLPERSGCTRTWWMKPAGCGKRWHLTSRVPDPLLSVLRERSRSSRNGAPP